MSCDTAGINSCTGLPVSSGKGFNPKQLADRRIDAILDVLSDTDGSVAASDADCGFVVKNVVPIVSLKIKKGNILLGEATSETKVNGGSVLTGSSLTAEVVITNTPGYTIDPLQYTFTWYVVACGVCGACGMAVDGTCIWQAYVATTPFARLYTH